LPKSEAHRYRCYSKDEAPFYPSSAGNECEGLDGDGGALGGPVAIVEVVEAATEALPENIGAAESQAAVAADGEASGEDSTGLGWLIELELEVGRNVARAADGVGQDAVAQADFETGVGLAGDELVGGASGSGSNG